MKVEVDNLVRTFGTTRAVDKLSFSFSKGQVFGFVGPNGAGKTTTMRIMATLDEPTEGDVRIDGVSVVQSPEEARRRVGFVPDSLPSHRDMTIAEYLDFFARASGLKGDHRKHVLRDVEHFTGVTPIREKQLFHLSKGMKQRVNLARALLHDPDLLILDEPAAGLDPKARIELRELILALAESGKAIFISSHILDELGELCDGVVIIEQGKLIHAGTIGESRNKETNTMGVWIRVLGDVNELHRLLLERHDVISAEVFRGEIRVTLTDSDEACVALLSELVGAGIPVVEFRNHREDLEDVFMQVTSGRVQ